MARHEWNKVILPIAVISVVGMILFPMPSQLLDVLLVANFAFCILLLISSVFVSEPDKFTSLPTILLLSTLFRLGLNVSSTRVILSGNDVPEIITSFGHFVVAGSTIVGLVIFGIISIIQFIVIAKGTERVAEVAARFTLDALPGKQMSIDADMRAGLISISEAREKRKELHRESKLYGALDGAMKFVKGDAIVGLCIIFINISAGFLIGVTRDGMSIVGAIEQYTLLTIGDGLISQIPAVLVSIAAGIVVTRVSEKDGGQLSEEILSQLSLEPLTLLISSFLLITLACLPGLPFFPFLLTSVVPFFLWNSKRLLRNTESTIVEVCPFKPKLMPPIVLRLSALGARQLQLEGRIVSYFDALRALIFEERGVILPDLSFDIDPVERFITCEIIISGQSVQKLKFIPEKVIPGCLDSWSRCLGTSLKEQVFKSLKYFINDFHTRNLLDLYEQSSTDVVRSIVPDRISVTSLSIIMKNLVAERFCIRDVGLILQSLGEIFEINKLDNREVSANSAMRSLILVSIRKNLMRNYLLKVLGNETTINAFMLDTDLEDKVLAHIDSDLPFHPDLLQNLKLFFELLHVQSMQANKIYFVLVPSRIRLAVYEVSNVDNRNIFVLSKEEVPDDFVVNMNSFVSEDIYEAAA
jgi:flagellar biosynthesis component FlhA